MREEKFETVRDEERTSGMRAGGYNSQGTGLLYSEETIGRIRGKQNFSTSHQLLSLLVLVTTTRSMRTVRGLPNSLVGILPSLLLGTYSDLIKLTTSGSWNSDQDKSV